MSYFHAGGIDRPLVIAKNGESIVPHQNWRGQFARGTYADGRSAGKRSDCTACPPSGCTPIQWPGERTTAYHELEPQGEIHNWFGGLVDDMRDASGQMYRRNRGGGRTPTRSRAAERIPPRWGRSWAHPASAVPVNRAS